MNPASPGFRAYAAASVVSAAAFAAACVVGGVWLLLVVPAAALLLWFLPRAKAASETRERAQTAALVAMAAAGGLGVLLGLSPLLLVASVSAAVAVWDLAALNRRSRGASDPEAARRVERGHVRRLVVTAGGGAVLGAAAVLVRVRLGFAVLLALGVALAIGLSLFLRALRGAGDGTP